MMARIPIRIMVFLQVPMVAMMKGTTAVPRTWPRGPVKFSMPLMLAMRSLGISLILTTARGARMAAATPYTSARPRNSITKFCAKPCSSRPTLTMANTA